VAPFLRLDHDPYLVVADRRAIWLQDAYTVSDALPYSHADQDGVNYIRNAVKIAVDAYEGTLTFYLADAADPLVRTYARIFPTLFRPLEAMPLSLRQHIRYPAQAHDQDLDALVRRLANLAPDAEVDTYLGERGGEPSSGARAPALRGRRGDQGASSPRRVPE
jgi:uncharacterized membrane protein (UPF0182 family)